MKKLLFTLLLFLSGCTSSKEGLKILALGDSLTFGALVDDAESYPEILENLLNENGYPSKVVNEGVNGMTSQQLLKKVDSFLDDDLDWILLCIGANDGLRESSLKNLDKNLRSLVSKIRNKKIKLLFIGMKLPQYYSAAYRSEFEGIYERLAHEEDLLFMPFLLEGVAGKSDLNLSDGLHPNGKGYQMIAQRVYSVLESEL